MTRWASLVSGYNQFLFETGELSLHHFGAYSQMTRGINKPEDNGIREIVGRNVKAAREYAGLSQRELSNRAKVAQSYLSQCESGKWNIGVDNIARIAKATGFNPHDLMNPKFEPTSFDRIKFRT